MRQDQGLRNAVVFAVVVLAALVMTGPPAPAAAAGEEGVWLAEYYANRELSGPIIFSETLPGPFLIKEWPWGEGPKNGVPDDKWSARFTTHATFPGGNVKFLLNSDDGSRLYLNGEVILDEWHERAATWYAARVLPVPAGTYTIMVEYYDTGGINKIEALWQATTDLPAAPDANFVPAGTGQGGGGLPTGIPVDMWRADYYSNRDLEGAITFSEVLPGPYLERDWLWGFGPQNGVPDDEWSARFTTRHVFPGGNVKFFINSDDGSRMLLNGQVIIDEWHDRAATWYTARVLPIPAGMYEITVEYYEAFGINKVSAGFEPTTDLPAAPDAGFVPAPLPPDQQPAAPTGQPGTSPAGGQAEGGPTLATPPPGGIVVDANTPAFAWAGSNEWGYGFGGLLDNLYLFVGNSAFAPRLWARWNPSLPSAGYYDIYVWIPANPAATTNARYRVFHSGTLSPVIAVNQRENGGQWVWIGNFYFAPGASQYLYLNDLTFESADSTWVLFDAVKFVYSDTQ